MKRLTLFAFSLALATTACKQGTATQTATDSIPTSLDIKGLYKGDFGGDPLFLTINFQTGQHVAGYDQHKGLRRNVSGEINKVGDQWIVSLREPGDNTYDGTFEITFDPKAVITGTWKPFDKTAAKEKTFTLKAMSSEHNNDSLLVDNTFTADHCDFSFDSDGSCTLNYYKKITDTTFEGQMITLRGGFTRTGNKIFTKWSNATDGHQKADTFNLAYHKEEDYTVVDSLWNKDFILYVNEGD